MGAGLIDDFIRSILSVLFCPYHFFRYHFVLEPFNASPVWKSCSYERSIGYIKAPVMGIGPITRPVRHLIASFLRSTLMKAEENCFKSVEPLAIAICLRFALYV